MESPVVLEKPPEYGNMESDRGFPFDEEEGSSAWSNLAARHPDIAARLRARPHSWARKRRPSAHDAAEDFDDEFAGFDRFPFADIPAEFREHFPSHFNRRFEQEQPAPSTQTPPSTPPQQQTTSTQTTSTQTEEPPLLDSRANLSQHGLRNTVDLGQKSPVDPSVDADERCQRAVSAPPETSSSMSSPPHHEPAHPAHSAHPADHGHVRHIPIFVEGRDEPVINKNVDQGHTESRPPPPPVDREQYFSDDVPAGFHHPPNFSRAFGAPFAKGFRQGPQPFVQQKVYPQAAQSPKPQSEHFVKVPVHHEQTPTPRTQAKAQAQPQAHPHPQAHYQPQAHSQPQAPPQPQPQAPPQSQPQAQPQPPPASPNDPITQILSVQTDVLNLMTEVENFTGTKGDKRYMFLDEMLTRNLIKLDNIETEGKENIRLARKEAIKCIQKCIAVLEAKAEQGASRGQDAQPEQVETEAETKEDVQHPPKEESVEETATPEAADTRPQEQAPPKMTTPTLKKKIKKRDKSKEKTKASDEKEATEKPTESMQVDDQTPPMEVDAAASQ